MISHSLDRIKDKLVVSCQAEGDSPFNTPEGVNLFALAAQMGGAGGIRAEGIEKIRKIKNSINLPLIGLIKSTYPDGLVCITRQYEDIESLIELKVDIISIDGTFREVNGLTGPEFIGKCKEKFRNICILADVSQVDEALACVKSRADGVTTCLRGYTPETLHEVKDVPNIYFINELCNKIKDFPIIAEGKINTPALAAEISKLGVWCIIVGSAITRPHMVTQWFAQAISKSI
jgi:N-acylglucosamine-6-phosphate 2-epimerase